MCKQRCQTSLARSVARSSSSSPSPTSSTPAPAPRSLADMDWRELILIRSLAGVILARLADLCPPRLALGRFALAMGVWVLL